MAEEAAEPTVGIIHLSDIHFSDEMTFSPERQELLFRALKDDFSDCLFVYLVVSGDIANTGRASEYICARAFLEKLVELLGNRYPSTQFKTVLVPGNHDCNFDLDSSLREAIVARRIDYDTLGKDASVLEMCLAVQSEFWNFYSYFDTVPDSKLYYRIVDRVADKGICFHCFNTAWMSNKNETPGTLFFPTKRFEEVGRKNGFDLSIAVHHHPLNWFTPDTQENNRRALQNLLGDISSLQLTGHEGENELQKTENLDRTASQVLCITGDDLQTPRNPGKSGFQTLLLNLRTIEVTLKRYRFKDLLYQEYSKKRIVLLRRTKMVVDLNDAFTAKLNRIEIPLDFGEKQVELCDVYVFPDLEILSSKPENTAIDKFIDSERLLDNDQYRNCILEGDGQIGKSSLLYMLFFRFYEKGFYPILLHGNDITSDNVDGIIQKAFQLQYAQDSTSYDRFKQVDKHLKVLLIDDLHSSKWNKSTRSKGIKTFLDLFSRSFITLDTAYSIVPQIQTESKGTHLFSIKPLGFKKSDDLVQKYLAVKDPTSLHSDQDHLERTKRAFNQLRQVLRDKLIPSYPAFVLAIVQALEHKPLNLNETSYGYCYQTLIHLALANAGVSKDDIDSYINIITELAFHMFMNKTESITEADYEAYYEGYRTRFVAPRFDAATTRLLGSKVLKQDDSSYSFGYKYILYFLAAKKIAEMIDRPQGQAIVKELYDNVHKEKNANILVLITHHTRNYDFIQEAMLKAMLPFEKTLPITLERNCSYYKLLAEIAEEIKQDVIEMNRNPSEERKNQLLAQDKFDRETNQSDEEEGGINDKIVPFIQAFRSIEIVGQIIRNRKGSLEKGILKEMVSELYGTAFRMISFLGEIIREAKDDLSQRIDADISGKDSNEDVEERIYRFLQIASLHTCLAVFAKLVLSSGVRELREIYVDVARELNTPAAKLVSFSINSYYGRMSLKELEELSREFDGNVVAFWILRARVKSYVYNNFVDYKDKQRIAAYLKMSISPALGHKERGY
jgi:predicted MPP superfamily phosphohydrolase